MELILTKTIDTIEDINIDWLNSALEGIDEFDKDPVKELKVNPMGEGIGQLGQFALLKILRDSGKVTKIFAKAQTPNEDMDDLARDYLIYAREVKFYKDLASKVDVKTPYPYYVEFNERENKVILLLEFMDGWHTPDQIAGASKEEIFKAIEGLISINSSYWGETSKVEWLPGMLDDYMYKAKDDIITHQPEFLLRHKHIMDSSRQKDLRKISEFYPTLCEILSQEPLTLTHFDYRVENIFFSSDMKKLAVIDWQLVMKNLPGYDLAYLLFSNTDVDLRRNIFEDCCNVYLSGLKDRNLDLSHDELHKNMMYSLMAQTIVPVNGGANFDLENQRSRKLFEVIADRMFSAIEDYDATSYIG